MELSDSRRLAKNWQAPGQSLPIAPVGRAFDQDGLNKIAGGSLERDALDRWRESCLDRDDGRVCAERSLKGFCPLNDPGQRERTFDHIRNFMTGVIVEPQVFEAGARGVEGCSRRQSEGRFAAFAGTPKTTARTKSRIAG